MRAGVVLLAALTIGVAFGHAALAVEDSSAGSVGLSTALQSAQNSSYELEVGGDFSVGLMTPPPPLAGINLAGTPSPSGYLVWNGDTYRLGATFHPMLAGGMSADIFAGVGASPGQPGTSYGVRIGTARSGLGFGIVPTNRLGLSSATTTSTNDVNLSFTVNHMLTSGLSLIGTAEARRGLTAGPADQTQSGEAASEIMIGAGLGVRF